jgi:hypothetical protein
MERLKGLAKESRSRDVYLICCEGEDKPCHRRLLLQIAREVFGEDVDPGPVDRASTGP